MAEVPLRVLVAGGGVAGLETLLGLHSLAGDRVALTLLAPEDEFVFRPLQVKEPFPVGRVRTASLADAAEHVGATYVPDTVDSVDTRAQFVTASRGSRREYDALVLAVGAEPMPAIPRALTWDDRADADVFGGLLGDIEQGYSRRVAIVVPPGPGWPLRGYELALLVALQGRSMGPDVEVTLVTPEPSQLRLLGARAVELVSAELDAAGVTVVSAERAEVEPGRPSRLVLEPSGRRVEFDRVVALPVLRGRRIAGVPSDADGFVEVDSHCRVRGLSSTWAVGDATSFPVKSGGAAAQQADAAAEDIAAVAGAEVQPREFDPKAANELSGLPSGRFLREWLAAGDEELTTHLPTGDIPVLTYLQRDLAAGWRGYG
jgi:sulfide:quinone oxidoreductase